LTPTRPNPLFHRRGAGFLLIAAFLAVGACSQRELAQEPEAPEELPGQIIWDFNTSESDSGHLRWILHGHEARFYEREPQIRASGVTLEIFDREGMPTSSMAADSGFLERQQGKGDMTARGNVLVISEKGYELRTSELQWDAGKRVFTSDSFVEVRQGRDLHTGWQVEADEKLERVSISKDPKHEIISEGEELP